ncbi:lipoprotein [Aliagarivorans taiwanensis]|uniref:transglycosylase SLT domain-containing protein n=1 Tax=Aliagarivorans taiwanensis TaxID=561966 RepID=UPI000424512A|nr:lipoprotein [Aliagarivorans taiwanensis]
MFKQWLIVALTVVSVSACSSKPPAQPENLCEIFKEKRDWYKAAKKMNKKWGTPVHVPMAMMYQESSFKHNARPPMQYWFGFIPVGRASDAYGFSQAKTMTWDDYIKETGRRGASRTNFGDAIDFMGWFTNKTYQINGVSKWDARNQYLNYHEGWTGYKRGTHHQKQWLIKVAGRVDERSKRYAAQYNQCKKDLDRSWLWRLFFG